MDFIVLCYFYVHGNRLAVFRELFLCQRYLESSLEMLRLAISDAYFYYTYSSRLLCALLLRQSRA
jgi:hypothetical protein